MDLRCNEENSFFFKGLFLIFLITLIRLIFIGRIGLGVDESHYWQYSRHLSLSYFDHPPMVGWLIALFSFLGRNPFAVRLPAVFCSMLTALLLYDLVRRSLGNRVGYDSLILFFSIPIFYLLGMIILPDAPLILFWTATLWSLQLALSFEKGGYFLLSGIFLGFALLSKYHAILLPLLIGCFLLLSPKYRRWLKSPFPYLALFFAFIIFLPVLVWNYSHDWISFRYQFHHGHGKGSFSFLKLLTVIGGQLGVISPLLWIALLLSMFIATKIAIKKNDEVLLYFSIFSWPILIFFSFFGSIGKMLPHWPTVSYISAIPLLSLLYRKGYLLKESKKRKWAFISISLGIFWLLLIHIGVYTNLVEFTYNRIRNISLRFGHSLPAFKAEWDMSNDLYGWDQLALKVVEYKKRVFGDKKEVFVFSYKFYTASQLAFYLPDDLVITSLYYKPDQYYFWFNRREHKGWDAIYVYDYRFPKSATKYYKKKFRLIKKGTRVIIKKNGKMIRKFMLYPCFNFKGK